MKSIGQEVSEFDLTADVWSAKQTRDLLKLEASNREDVSIKFTEKADQKGNTVFKIRVSGDGDSVMNWTMHTYERLGEKPPLTVVLFNAIKADDSNKVLECLADNDYSKKVHSTWFDIMLMEEEKHVLARLNPLGLSMYWGSKSSMETLINNGFNTTGPVAIIYPKIDKTKRQHYYLDAKAYANDCGMSGAYSEILSKIGQSTDLN